MPFVSRETLDQDQQERWRLEDTLDDVRGQLAVALAAGNIVEVVAWRIAELKESGVTEQEAANMVQFELEQAERAKITAQIAEGLKDRKRKEVEKRIRTTEGPKIKQELTDLYETDGTFAYIEDEVTARVRQEIADGIHADESARIYAELSDPAKRAEIIAEIMKERADDSETESLRAAIRQQLEEQWDQEAQDQLLATVTAEEEAREEAYKKAKMESLKGGSYEANNRKVVRSNLETKWGKEATEKVLEEIKSEELAALVAKRIELEKKKVNELTKAVTKEKLHSDFMTNGVDMDALVEGTKVTVVMGSKGVGKYEKRVKDSYYGGYKNVITEGEVIVAKRVLHLVKTADNGYFHVQHDSLADSKSPYEQAAALVNGTIIAIGRNIIKNGKNVFDHKISQNTQFAYDDNTDEAHVTDGLVPVANIIVDDIWASDLPYGIIGDKAYKVPPQASS